MCQGNNRWNPFHDNISAKNAKLINDLYSIFIILPLHSSGSDGLLKLWTIKTNECVKTFDAHDDKVWALAVNKAESCVVTGAGDSNIIMWKVSTAIVLMVSR